MFKNYLTYQFALNFDRGCHSLEVAPPWQEQLRVCSRNMLIFFERSVRDKEPQEELRNLCVSILYLRECREIMTQARIEDRDLLTRFEVVHGRLERLCANASVDQDGQLRLFG